MALSIPKRKFDELADYAGANALLYRPTNQEDRPILQVPLSLRPSPFPRALFNEACQNQFFINVLASNLAMNPKLMGKELDRVGKHDSYVANLLRVQEAAHETGKLLQPIGLGIMRTDYMVEKTSGELRMVEMNTIAVGGLYYGSKVGELHRLLWKDSIVSGDA